MLSHYFIKVFIFCIVLLNVGNLTAVPLLWNAPAQNLHFVGREEQIDQLQKQLENKKRVTLSGYSGLGKSQIAKEYIHQHGHAYHIVWWFHGNQYLDPQFQSFAALLDRKLNLGLGRKLDTMGSERLVMTIFYELERRSLNCLFVFDDVTTVEKIKSYIPNRVNSHLIFTTQNANFSDEIIPITYFKREESQRFLGSIFLDSNSKDLNDLAEHLHDNPSSLALASEYIRQYPGMTIGAYVRKHKNTLLRMGQRQRYGDPTDAYERDLLMATQLNVEALKNNSATAYTLLSFLTLSHLSGANMDHIHAWMDLRNIPHQEVVKLLNHMKDYSLVNIDGDKVGMHELIQRIVSELISDQEKTDLINEIVSLLLETFSGNLELISERMLKDTDPLIHAERILHVADEMDYHTVELSILRARVFDVFTCGVRDLDKATEMADQLSRDFQEGIILPKQDEALYYVTLSLFSAMNTSKCDAAIEYGEKALALLENLEGLESEKLRMISNFIQYYSLTGELDKCSELVRQGQKLLPVSKIPACNALFILASTLYLMDKGQTQEVIDLIQENSQLLDRVTLYPTLKFYILNQLAEAQLKEGQPSDCLKTLEQSEQCASEFYKDTENSFFANLKTLRASAMTEEGNSIEESEILFKESLETFGRIFKDDDYHRGQGLGNLMYGQFLATHKRFDEAKEALLESKKVFDQILKNQVIDDVSNLYVSLSILGIDLIEEELTQVYLKKHMELFGATHPRTKEILITLDERGLSL